MFRRRCLYVTLISSLAILFHTNLLAQSQDRSQTIREMVSLKKELREKEKELLSPPDKDEAAFAEFLKQTKTGLIRLLPQGMYEGKVTIRGGGAYYSFAHSTHEPNFGYDIELAPISTPEYTIPLAREYILRTGYGFITALGGDPIEKVTLDHNGVKFLATYNPPSTAAELNAEQRRVRRGIDKNRYGYNRSALVTINFTYALRSINYGQSDVLVAFRVVRKDIDGSMVILWKVLKEFPKPAYPQFQKVR